MYRKNTASQFVCVQLLLTATGAVATGLSPTVRRCIDGTFAAGGGTVTEDSNGFYKYAMAQADTNGNDISLTFSATGAMPVCINFVTTAADPTDTVRFGLTAMPNVASGSAGALIVSGTGTAALSVSSGLVTLAASQPGVTIPTVTTVTNQLTAAAIATGVWTDTTAGDFTTALSVGKSVMNGVSLGTGLTVAAVSGAVGSVTGAVGSVTGAVGSVTGNVGGNVVGSVASVTGAVGSVTGAVGSISTGGITRASLAADTGLQPIRSNTAQAGASTTITLDASASATNSFYNNCLCYLTGGTGVGQSRFITGYVGATKVATVNSAWATNPDNTTTFAIEEFDAVPGATAPTAAQVATAVWQDATAGDFTVSSSIGKSLYTSGNAPGAASGIALVGSNMGTITGALTAAQIATGVWQDATAGDFTTASSIGKSLYNAFTANTSVYTVAALANAPSGTGASASAIATAVWQDATAGDFTAAGSIGKSIMNGVALGTGLTVNDITTKTGYSLASSQTFDNTGTWTGNITGNLSGSVGSVTGAVGSVTGAVGSVTGAVGSVTGNVGGNVVGSVASVTGAVGSVTGAVGSVTGNIGGNVVGSVASVTARVTANTDQFNGDTTSAANIAKTTRAIGRGTVSGSPSVTSIPTSACTPSGAVADQFKGRIITFDADTTSTALRGQATDITASSNSATPTFTVTALTTAPASGDTFSIT